MTFSSEPTLTNEKSSVRLDVEAIARIEISDIEYLLKLVGSEPSPRMARIHTETLVQKCSVAFQLALRACDYLERPDLRKKFISEHSKDSASSLGLVAKARDGQFHKGTSATRRRATYPFACIEGRGFVGIRVTRDALLRVKGYGDIGDSSSEYVFTPEGPFRIDHAGSADECWVALEQLHVAEWTNETEIQLHLAAALDQLKIMWAEVSKIRRDGDGKHSIEFMNDGGKCSIYDASNANMIKYDLPDGVRLNITGLLVLSPPEGIPINEVFGDQGTADARHRPP